MLRLICIVASVSIAAADFVPADEACGNDEEDCALSLRQLRGHQAEVEVSEHRAAPLAESPQVNELAEPIEVTPDTAPEEAEEDEYDEDLEEEIKINETARQNKREAEEGGTCCFSGENSKDTCGTCYPMSIASYKSKCSKKNNCMGCGGTWCQSTCVIGAADPLRKCQTAYPTGVSKDPVCSRDPIACHGCQGEWCRAGYNSHFVIEENSHGREVPEYMAPEDTDGICCYRGEQKNDTCGTCADIAKDTTCSVKSRCSGCGGTWCPAAGPKCVKAFKDPEDPCKSAEPMTGIAERWDFCALNEKHCTNCKGAWCLPGNITYYDGTKRLEEAGGHSWEESPASSDVNETDAVEASPASLGEEVHSKKTSSLLSDVKNCPLSSFYARRLYGFPPSVWFDSDEESEDDESLAKSGTTSSGADENATN